MTWMLSATIGFMQSLHDNHQAEKESILEKFFKKLKKRSQNNVYIRIAYNSFRVCVCV